MPFGGLGFRDYGLGCGAEGFRVSVASLMRGGEGRGGGWIQVSGLGFGVSLSCGQRHD